MLNRGIHEPEIKPFSEDLLEIDRNQENLEKKAIDQILLSEIKEESNKKITHENEEKDPSDDEFVFMDEKEINEGIKEEIIENMNLEKQKGTLESTFEQNQQKIEKDDELQLGGTEAHVEKNSREMLEKKAIKTKEKHKLKEERLARNERKLKFVESIASSSENSSTKVVKKNFLHLIKSKNMPFSLKVISFLGYLGFLGLALTFSVLYSLLYQSFQELNENLNNIMFGHNFARPLGFIIKGIEQKIILENYFSELPDRSAYYDDVQLLMESLGDYEYSYIQLINLDVKFQYQDVFMNGQMELKLYNLDQDPTQVNLVLIHAFGIYIEHMRMCLKEDGPTLMERGNEDYYFLYQNSMELINEMIEINVSTAQEAYSQMTSINSMIVLFLVLAEIVVFFITMIILPIFVQVNKRKEEALVLFCSFQQDVLVNKISIYTNIYNEVIAKINDISDQYSKTLSDVSFINLIKKQRKKISISQHSKLKVNFNRIAFIILLSFIIISIYPLANFIVTNQFLNSFTLNIQENVIFGELSSSFSLFYAINYFNINYQFYAYKQGLPLLNTTITQSWQLNWQIFEDILNYVTYDLDQLIASPYISNDHKAFLLQVKGDNLCELIPLSPEKFNNCSSIYKEQMKMGLIVVLKSISDDFNNIYTLIEENPNNEEIIQQWLDTNNFFDLDLLLEYMQPITTLIINNAITNFQNYLNLQIALITGLFIFGLSVLVLIGGVGFLHLIKYLNELLFNARFLLSVLPIDLIQENSYLLSHLTKEFKKIKL